MPGCCPITIKRRIGIAILERTPCCIHSKFSDAPVLVACMPFGLVNRLYKSRLPIAKFFPRGEGRDSTLKEHLHAGDPKGIGSRTRGRRGRRGRRWRRGRRGAAADADSGDSRSRRKSNKRKRTRRRRKSNCVGDVRVRYLVTCAVRVRPPLRLIAR